MSIIPSQTRIHKIIDSNEFNFYCFKEKFGNEFIAIFLYGDAFTTEVIRCFNENEEFYKIGITSSSIQHRYNSTSKMPYKYEIIQEIYDTPEIIYNLVGLKSP